MNIKSPKQKSNKRVNCKSFGTKEGKPKVTEPYNRIFETQKQHEKCPYQTNLKEITVAKSVDNDEILTLYDQSMSREPLSKKEDFSFFVNQRKLNFEINT